MKVVLAVVAALALAACNSSKPISELSYSEVKALASVIDQRCVDQGIGPNSPEWDACTKQEITRENARRVRARQVADSTVICNQVGTSTICL